MRALAFVAIGVLLALVQANAHRALGWTGIHGASPSLVLPMVVYLGVHEQSIVRGAFLSFCLGHAIDLIGSAPLWLFTFIYVALFWLSRVAAVRLAAQTVITRVTMGFVFALVEGTMVIVLAAIFGEDGRRPLELATIILPKAIATAIASPLVFRIAQRLHSGGQAAGAAPEASGA